MATYIKKPKPKEGALGTVEQILEAVLGPLPTPVMTGAGTTVKPDLGKIIEILRRNRKSPTGGRGGVHDLMELLGHKEGDIGENFTPGLGAHATKYTNYGEVPIEELQRISKEFSPRNLSQGHRYTLIGRFIDKFGADWMSHFRDWAERQPGGARFMKELGLQSMDDLK